MDWLISQDVKHIRALVDSDNLPTRIVLERNNFIGHFLSINPSARVTNDDASPEFTNDFTAILDNSFYERFYKTSTRLFAGNILVAGTTPLSRIHVWSSTLPTVVNF